jgi:leader peptidase (prepilin peptidase) / N-methyltransferase
MQSIFPSPLFTALIGLCLGSFLHALAHRIAFERPILRPRSHCPHCDSLITWYDNIPVISWLVLGGRCRECAMQISWIYPFTELATSILLTLIWHHFPLPLLASGIAYSIFIAALIVATVTDLHTFTIPQVASLWVAPLGIVAAACGLLHISLRYSIMGACLGYLSLWLVNFIFKKIRGIDGMGVGDMELFCMIGAFIGPLGLWQALLVASVGGSLAGIAQKLFNKNATNIIPFGPFLALGACCHLFLGQLLWYVLTLGF